MNSDQAPASKISWLDPYWSDPTVKASIVISAVALLGLIMARAPEIAIDKVFGVELAFPVNAVMAILAAPPQLAIATWLLSRSALHAESASWRPGDVTFIGIVLALLGIVAIGLWLQFFIVIAPTGAGQCGLGPRFDLFWTSFHGPTQMQHCMSTGKNINGWFYVEPVWVQAWLNTLLTAASLFFIYRTWRSWRRKRVAAG